MKNKFKVFDMASKQMRYVRSIIWIGDKIKEISFQDGFWKPFSNDLILLQSTGARDDDGNLIYEGDIIKHDRLKWKCVGHPEDGGNLSNLVVIYWNEHEGQFYHDVYDQKRCFCSGSGAHISDNRAKTNIRKIIGNIYQNKKLLPKG